MTPITTHAQHTPFAGDDCIGYTSETIKGEIYRVYHHHAEPFQPGLYVFHKMGTPGHKAVASESHCTCESRQWGIARVGDHFKCKHMTHAARMDSHRFDSDMETVLGFKPQFTSFNQFFSQGDLS